VPWKVDSPMSLRREFVVLASNADANVSLLCRRFGISRKTGYKWLARARLEPSAELADGSRRPHRSPTRTGQQMEQLILNLRSTHPAWGARKLKRRLEDLQQVNVPARSTVNQILHRHGLIDPLQSLKHKPIQRFQRQEPNELWQMDFKGPVHTANGGKCHPLTMLDDCSRYNLLLKSCPNQQNQTVREALTQVMRRYGMPLAILADNGPPWGSFGSQEHWTSFGAWLIRRGVQLIHGRPLHPQTQGKEERFHRTLNVEVLRGRTIRDSEHCQKQFDEFRQVYNHQRPHEALDMAVPASRYRPAARAYPEVLEPIEYGSNDHVRRVCIDGRISFQGNQYKVGLAFSGEPVAVRPTAVDGKMQVFYCHEAVAEIDLRDPSGDR
jgi:transposase InsO family protein